MRKYLTVFGLSFQNEFTYRLNFLLWRLRNVLRILMVFILWTSIFASNKVAFGYTKEQMMSYVFLVLIIGTFVIASPSNDNIGGEIGSGDLSNFLTKPISYLRYWLTRDWASKLLNIIFAVFEITILYLILKPSLFISTSPTFIFLGIIMGLIASLIYFLITKLATFVSFWSPENTWGVMFLFLVIFEILSGSIFPLDILPKWGFTLLQFTPFPYMVYYPLGILIGKFSPVETQRLIFQSFAWLLISYWLTIKVWKKGLKVYSSSGR